jgi:CBS domain-containing protein
MRIEQLMTRSPSTCRPHDTLRDAAQLMLDNGCACLPVTTGNGSERLVGIITDHDLCMAAQYQGKTLNELRVDQVMSRKVHTCRPADGFAEAQAIMWAARVRRLPVVNEFQQLVGLVSLSDLAREALRDQAPMEREITEAEICELLTTIAEPRMDG